MEVDNSASKKKIHLKVVIIGSAAVGKTTFVQRYFEKQFKETSSDTAGEERFRGLSNFYCRGAGAAIVAFDLTDEDSFHAIRAIYVPLLESALDDCVKVVIGTKSDLLTTLPRAVSVEDGENLAREINSARLSGQKLYFETSSMKGQNVDQVFEEVFKLCTPAMKKLLDEQGGAQANIALKEENQGKSSCAC